MLKKMARNNEVVLFGILLILFVVFSLLSPYFIRVSNLFLISGQMVELGLLTLGMTVVLISGGFDLSIGALGSFCTIILGVFINHMSWSIWASLGVVLCIAIGVGLVNGLLCGYLKIEPMLATLGTGGLISGLALGISKARIITIKNPEYFFGKLRIGDIIPFQFIILLAAIAVTIVLLNYTRLGRRMYMMGSNKETAVYSGINVRKTTLKAYIFSAVMAFLAAVVISSRMESGRSNLLDTQVLHVVTAAVFGGVSVKGGRGNVVGAIIGVITFSVISNALNLIGISQFLKQLITGLVLLFVLALTMWRERMIIK